MSTERLPIFDDAHTDGREWLADLRGRLPDLRSRPGFPQGTDEAIAEMSAPPAYTACPSPYLRDFVEDGDSAAGADRGDPGPFAADTTAGKTSLVYRAHNYPTKVPHEAIMRLILHYTEPGDVVLDGFCGTGMTGVAAQMCGIPTADLRRSIEGEMGPVRWGARRSVLQDLSPSATFIAAGLNLPVDAAAFDQASRALLDRFDAELGWMYETTDADGEPAQIDFTVWSQIFSCPRCAGEVIFYDVALDLTTGRVADELECPSCGVSLSKRSLQPRRIEVTTLAGDRIQRPDFRPVALQWRRGNGVGTKAFGDGDRERLRRVSSAVGGRLPTISLPYMHMTHERSAIYRNGFQRVDQFYTDRALLTLATLWQWAAEEEDPAVQRGLKFWIEQGFWGFSWMNRYVPTHYSHVNQFLSGVYYIGSLHAEPSPRYNLVGSSPNRGKRHTLVRLWTQYQPDPRAVRISTGSSTTLDVPDESIDYIFVDPPFGENIYYADIAFLAEAWHGVITVPDEEAIIDRNKRRTKELEDYAFLMERCFGEFHRVLKPGRWMTVEFSNSSNEVWIAIQRAIDSVGFVVADTRVFDKTQHSFRQLTATNAVKRDLIISAYKPANMLEERVRVAAGSEAGVWAFVEEHLAHLPVSEGTEREPRIVRERQADRLYDRMVAYHVARGVGVPMTSAEFYAALERRYAVREGMSFLPQQVEGWEEFRARSRDLEPSGLFITNETSAVRWLRDRLRERPQSFSEIQPVYFAETQKGTDNWEELPDLSDLLADNFVLDDQKHWTVPDPRQAHHLEQLRQRDLLKEFEQYKEGRGPLERFRSEAVRAGFNDAYHGRDFHAILAVGRRLPTEAFVEDIALLHYFRNAERMAA